MLKPCQWRGMRVRAGARPRAPRRRRVGLENEGDCSDEGGGEGGGGVWMGAHRLIVYPILPSQIPMARDGAPIAVTVTPSRSAAARA